jgi:putative oxidoreductase
MYLVNKIERWGNRHHPKILDLIRMMLGVYMTTRGSVLLMKLPFIEEVMLVSASAGKLANLIPLFLIYVIYSLMTAGALVFLGLYTRVAALIALPAMLVTIYFAKDFAAFVNSDTWLVMLLLLLLFQFMIIGSGPLSLDFFLSGLKFGKDDRNLSTPK